MLDLIFDTHAHYYDSAYDADRDALLMGLREKGVGFVLQPGCSMESSRNAVMLAKKYDFLYAAVGIHPEDAGKMQKNDLSELKMLAKYEKVRAIGEIGLDYHYESTCREVQIKCFESQLKLAEELNMCVIIHERDALEDTMRVLDKFPDVRGVFHCFSGSVETATQLITRGWYISITGILTFKNAKKPCEVMKMLPADRYMLETDAPYMSPEPYRGKRNSSAYLIEVVKKAAALRGVTSETVIHETSKNAMRLFGIAQHIHKNDNLKGDNVETCF